MRRLGFQYNKEVYILHLKRTIAAFFISASFLTCSAPMVLAEQQMIEATGTYAMQNSKESISEAQDKARKEAMRLIVEKAGVYVESYSKTEKLTLTTDQVRVIAGQIIKIEKDEVKPVIGSDGKTITYVCSMRAIVDTDKINLQRAMETKKTAEDNVRLKKSMGELQTENQTLRTQYEQAKDDNEKMRIQNELLSNEQALGTLYQNEYQNTAVLKEIRDVTADSDSIKRAYIGMPNKEFQMQVHPALLQDGWTFKNYNGNLDYTRKLDSNFRERLAFPLADKFIGLEEAFFETQSKVAADKVYRIAFANLYKSLGQPTLTYNENTSSASWKKTDKQGRTEEVSLLEWKSFDEYLVRLTKNKSNPQAVVHREMPNQEVLLSLARNDGDWYDDSGYKVLSIHNGTINDCPVIAGFDFAGGRGQCGTYRIQQASGPKDIKIERMSENSIRVNNSTILRDTPAEQFFESVNGVHLGMGESAVQQVLGAPERKETNQVSRATWYYDVAGLQLEFESGKIVQIRMLNNGDWFLGRSGLNYRNSIADFKSAYHITNMPPVLTQEQRAEGMLGGAIKIAKGEYLWLDYYPDVITLSIYWN